MITIRQKKKIPRKRERDLLLVELNLAITNLNYSNFKKLNHKTKN